MVNAYSLLAHFTVAGINYRKSDVSTRGKFSISTDQAKLLLADASTKLHGCFILSTCNRTEIYGIANHPDELIDLLCKHTLETRDHFLENGYVKEASHAVEHLFKVTAGLDSQIIGDYEILSQVKKSAQQAKLAGCLNNFTEKLINFALQASKEIKTTTNLSTGTVSVSYATIEIIKDKVKDLKNKKVLVVGTGKFGHVVGKNLKAYLPECGLYFCNRTDEKASSLAEACMADFISYKDLPSFADDADVIVVSSAAETYTIIPSFFKATKTRLVLDLSIPQNVDPEIRQIEGLELMNVDEISVLLNKTMSLRNAELPKALLIIEDTLQQMQEWCRLHANNKPLRTVKSQLFLLTETECNQKAVIIKIHRTVSTLAVQLRTENNKGCQCIHALYSYLQNEYDAAAC